MRRVSYTLLFLALLLAMFSFTLFSNQTTYAAITQKGTHTATNTQSAKIYPPLNRWSYAQGYRKGFADGYQFGLHSCNIPNYAFSHNHNAYSSDESYIRGYGDGYNAGFNRGLQECYANQEEGDNYGGYGDQGGGYGDNHGGYGDNHGGYGDNHGGSGDIHGGGYSGNGANHGGWKH